MTSVAEKQESGVRGVKGVTVFFLSQFAKCFFLRGEREFPFPSIPKNASI